MTKDLKNDVKMSHYVFMSRITDEQWTSYLPFKSMGDMTFDSRGCFYCASQKRYMQKK
jgi:hypothetical protein